MKAGGERGEGELGLLRRARAGDREAQRLIVERHQDDVYYLALGMLSDRHDAEDAMQEVFVRALQALDRFRGASGLATWLYRITANVCRDQQRRRRRTVFSLERLIPAGGEPIAERPGTDPQDAAAGGQLQRELARALDRLSQSERQVFALRKFRDLSVKETAEVLGIAEGSVKALLFRALRKLRRELSVSYI